MKKSFFYGIISAVTVLLCLPGCTEGVVSEGESDKRAIAADDSTGAAKEAETAVTTLTPLETFERMTAFQYRFGEESAAAENKKKETPETESGESGWFSEHKFFEPEIYEDDNSGEAAETWYRFQRDYETDSKDDGVFETRVVSTWTQTKKKTDKKTGSKTNESSVSKNKTTESVASGKKDGKPAETTKKKK